MKSDSKSVLFRFFLIALIVLAVAVQVLSTLDSNAGFISFLLNYRSIAVAALLALVAGLQMQRMRVPRGTLWYGLFSIYCFVNLLSHGIVDYAVMVLVWFGYTFIVFPTLFSRVTTSQIVGMVEALLVLLGLFLVGLYYYALTNGINLDWGTAGVSARVRFTSGLANPSIYSRVTFTGALLAGLLYLWTDRKVYIIYGAIAVSLLMSTDVRADFLGVVLAGLMYMIESKRLVVGKYIIWVLGAVVLILGAIYLNVSYYDLDARSSFRLTVWSQVIHETYRSEPLLHFLLGTGHSVFSSGVHYDNTPLEIICRYGIIGFVLFGVALNRTFARLQLKSRHARTVRSARTWNWCKAGLYGLMATSFFGTIVPSIGNASSLLMLPIIMALAYSPMGFLEFSDENDSLAV